MNAALHIFMQFPADVDDLPVRLLACPMRNDYVPHRVYQRGDAETVKERERREILIAKYSIRKALKATSKKKESREPADEFDI